MRSAVLILTLAASLALVACGSDKKTSSAAASNDVALKQNAAMRGVLKRAVGQVRAGDRKAAETTVAEGYLAHFELVEPALDKVDHPFRTKVEKGIREELRGKIHDGASVAEIQKLARSIDAQLVQVEQKLK